MTSASPTSRARRLAAGLGVLLLGSLAVLSGCGSTHAPPHARRPVQGGGDERRATGATPTRAAKPAAPPSRQDPVVARMRGHEVHASEVAAEVFRYFPDVASAALTRIIGSRVVEEEAARTGIAVPRGWRRRRRADLLKRLESDAAVAYGVGTKPETFVKLKFKRELKTHLRILLDEQRYNFLLGRVIRLHAMKADRVRLDVIVVATREKAQELAGRLAAGADFARLAERHSTHSSGRAGGRLDPVPLEALHPAASRAVSRLGAGERTGVLQVDDGGGKVQYEILRVVERLPGRTVSWEQARAEIEAGLRKEPVQRAEWTAWFLWLEKLYKVRLTDTLEAEWRARKQPGS